MQKKMEVEFNDAGYVFNRAGYVFNHLGKQPFLNLSGVTGETTPGILSACVSPECPLARKCPPMHLLDGQVIKGRFTGTKARGELIVFESGITSY